MTKEKADLLFCQSKYHEDFIFAFDNILDKEVIENKLKLIREVYPNKSQNIKFYVFCGSQNPERQYNDFYVDDIVETFERIKILSKYNCFPYIMRHADYINSPYSGLYSNLAAWCNQPQIFKKMSFREFCIERGMKYEVYKQYKGNYSQYLKDGYKKGATWRYMEEFEQKHPMIASEYFNMKFEELNQF